MLEQVKSCNSNNKDISVQLAFFSAVTPAQAGFLKGDMQRFFTKFMNK